MITPRDEQPPVSTPPAAETPDTSRRKFVVASMIAAPLLVTLTARPARAGTTTGTLGNYGSVTP
jgi:hypothetical protein